jgi:anti-sigma B factor antagonist
MASYSTTQDVPGVVVLSVTGELDAYSAPKIRAGLRAAISDPTTKQLRVDMAEVSFIDSSGISALIRGRAEAEARGIKLIVANPQPQPLKVMGIVGLTDFLGVTDGDDRDVVNDR